MYVLYLNLKLTPYLDSQELTFILILVKGFASFQCFDPIHKLMVFTSIF